ncbi:MAG: transcriptional regulator [bacterium]|nr:transcriptional regulator [bacterium]
MARAKNPDPARPERERLSPLIHGRVRLMLLSRLVAMPTAHTFTDLRSALRLTDGVLSVNLTKLEAAGLVSVEKTFEGRRPRTLVRITPQGVAQFRQYVQDLKAIVPGLAGR